MSVLLCNPAWGGCGHIGPPEDWMSRFVDPEIDFAFEFETCKICGEDRMVQITKQNIADLIQNPGSLNEPIKRLLSNDGITI